MKIKNLRNNQSGFTLIELVVVIVILGILAATALPKFIDMSGEARTAATQGVAGALGSASSINYAGSIAKGQINGATSASAVASASGVTDTFGGCTNGVATNLLQAGVSFNPKASNVAGSYNVTGATSLAAVGASTNCTVTSNDDTTKQASFTLIGTR